MPEGADIVVNATSVGLFPDTGARLDVDPDSLREGMVVADVIPNPPRTACCSTPRRAAAPCSTVSACSSTRA